MPLSLVERAAWMLRVQGKSIADTVGVIRRQYPDMPPSEAQALVALGVAAVAAGRDQDELPPGERLPGDRYPEVPDAPPVYTIVVNLTVEMLIESPPGSGRYRRRRVNTTIILRFDHPPTPEEIDDAIRDALERRGTDIGEISNQATVSATRGAQRARS